MIAQDVPALHKQMLSSREKAFMAHLQMHESLKECEANPEDRGAFDPDLPGDVEEDSPEAVSAAKAAEINRPRNPDGRAESTKVGKTRSVGVAAATAPGWSAL